MASPSDIKKMADELDIPYNDSWSDEDIFASIADQVGFEGYDYSVSAQQKLSVTLQRMTEKVRVYSKELEVSLEVKTGQQVPEQQGDNLKNENTSDESGEKNREVDSLEKDAEDSNQDAKEDEYEEPEVLDEDEQEDDDEIEELDENESSDDNTDESDDSSSNESDEDDDQNESDEDDEQNESDEDDDQNELDSENNNQDSSDDNDEDNESSEDNKDNENTSEEDSLENNNDNEKSGDSGENNEKGDGSKSVEDEEPGAEENLDNSNSSSRRQADKQKDFNGNDANPSGSSVDNAQKNLENSKRMKGGENPPSNPAKPVGPKTPAATGEAGKAAAGAKAASTGGKAAAAGSKAAAGGKAASSFIESKVVPFIAAHPWIILVIIGVILLIAIILIVIICVAKKDDGNITGMFGTGTCNYNLSGIVSNGSVELNSVKVELINCDASQSNYDVLGTVDFEKYVLGTALAEIGENTSDEAIKAQIIAVRNFALTRNRNMCPNNTDDCFYGYNPKTNVIRMRVCEADQVYWDYTTDLYRSNRGAISLYSPEANSQNGTLWKKALSEERKKQVEALAQSVKGKVLLSSTGDVLQTPYDNKTSTEFINGAQSGKTYEEILQTVYGSSNYSSATCSSYGNIDYGDYQLLSSSSDTILTQPLSTFLESKGTSLTEFNNLIDANVKNSGYGTRAGVVAAAVTLIGELGNKYGVRVPYFWGGGHSSGHIDLYANGTWGSSSCRTSANGLLYDHCGLDCSGFVPWAIYNGGFNLKEARLAYDFQNMQGARKVQLDASKAVVEPGDILESRNHVVLVVGIDEMTKEYICAEASGLEYGIWFTRRAFNEKGYYGLKMDDYYNNPSNIRGG